MTDEDILIAWAAGILEGEGCFRTKNDSHLPTVFIQMTDLDVLERVQGIFGGTISTVKKRQEHWKDCWLWYVAGEDAAKIMIAVKPYMLSRRSEKIDSVLNEYTEHLNRRKEIEEKRTAAGIEYLNSDLSLRQVAKKYGVSYESVRQAAIKAP